MTDKQSTRVSFRENLVDVIEPISNESHVNTDRSCLTNCCSSLYRRIKCLNTTASFLPLKPPYRTIKITDKTSVSIACNERYLLIKQSPYLCLLNKDLVIIKQIPWPYDHVNLCWSSTLNRFILITAKHIFLFDDTSSTFEQCSTIELIDDKEWSCGTCSETSFYLSANDMSKSIYEYTLRPTMTFVKQWNLSNINSNAEGPLTFTYSNGKLAFIISNVHSFQRRFDVYLSTTFEYLWSIRLNAIAHCCSINNQQWLIMELLNPRLLYISSDGQILEEYQIKVPSENIIWNALQWDNQRLVTFTMTKLNLHRL